MSTLQDDDELELPPKKYLSHSEGQHSFAGSPEEKSEEEEDETSLAAILRKSRENGKEIKAANPPQAEVDFEKELGALFESNLSEEENEGEDANGEDAKGEDDANEEDANKPQQRAPRRESIDRLDELLGEEADANEDVEAESKPAQEDDDDDIEWLKEISGVPQ